MIDEKFRKALDKYCEDHEVEIKILDNPSFDYSILGITEDNRLVYMYENMVQELIDDEYKDDQTPEESAIDFLDYNTLRALDYMGYNAPIVVSFTKDKIEDLFLEDTEVD